MGLLSNRRRFYREKLYDYEVEYLEINQDTGRICVDPDIYLSGIEYSIEMQVEIIDNRAEIRNQNLPLYSSIYNDDAQYYLIRNGGVPNLWITANNTKSFISTYNIDHSIGEMYWKITNNVETKKVSLYLNKLIQLRSLTDEEYPEREPESKIILFFFKYNNEIITDYLYLKFKSFRLIKKGKTVRSIIPVVKDGIGYLYDKISNRLFEAQGGQFEIGPRIK